MKRRRSLVQWAKGWLLLDRMHAASPGWALIHRGLLLVVVALVAAGTILPRLASEPSGTDWFGAGAYFFLCAGLSLYVLERLASSAYGYPLRRESLTASLLARHPWVSALLALLLHVETAVSAQGAWILDPANADLPLRGSAAVAITLCAVPFYFWLLHPLRLKRSGAELRGAKGSAILRSGRAVVATVKMLGEQFVQAVRNVRALITRT